MTAWTVAHQAPPSMEFSRQEYWSGLPFPSPGDLSDPGIKPRSPTLQADASGPITSWHINGEKMETVTDFIFLVSKITADGDCSHEIKRRLLFGFPGGSEVKASACNVGDLGSNPGSGRSLGEENGNPLQYSCLENPMDGGAWWATVHGVAKSRTQLSDFTFTFCSENF